MADQKVQMLLQVPQDLNCLRSVECIAHANPGSKHLRSRVAYQILHVCFQNKATDEEEVLRLLVSPNIKHESCDLFKVLACAKCGALSLEIVLSKSPAQI